MPTIEQLLEEAINQRNALADNLVIKGVSATHSETYNSLVPKVLKISGGGIDTSDANATASDILLGKSGYVKGYKINGSIPSIPRTVYTPTVTDQTILSGNYLSGDQIIQGDVNLIPSNIKAGIEIFGVTGTYSGGGSSKISILNTEECSTASDVLNLYGNSVYIYTSTSVTGTPIDSLGNIYNHFVGGQNNYISANSNVYGVCLGNWTENSCNNGILFLSPVQLNANSLIEINAYISSWMNNTLHLHLLTSDQETESAILEDLKQKIIDEDYEYTKDIYYPGPMSRADVYTELQNLSGTYYVYIDGTKTAQNDNFTYYSIGFINL